MDKIKWMVIANLLKYFENGFVYNFVFRLKTTYFSIKVRSMAYRFNPTLNLFIFEKKYNPAKLP
jgi:hypothetical protein